MDRLFEDFSPTRGLRGGNGPTELTFPVDVSDAGEALTVKAVLPGIKPEDVEITVSDGVLTIRGETRQETTDEKENYYHREIRYGSFSRSIALPSGVNQEQAEASFEDGILKVTLPKAAEARPRTIPVKGGATKGELVATNTPSKN
jgi:HSP20 family protein